MIDTTKTYDKGILSNKTLFTIGSVTADNDAATTEATAPCVAAWNTLVEKSVILIEYFNGQVKKVSCCDDVVPPVLPARFRPFNLGFREKYIQALMINRVCSENKIIAKLTNLNSLFRPFLLLIRFGFFSRESNGITCIFMDFLFL